jgi:hypothetical protein
VFRATVPREKHKHERVLNNLWTVEGPMKAPTAGWMKDCKADYMVQSQTYTDNRSARERCAVHAHPDHRHGSITLFMPKIPDSTRPEAHDQLRKQALDPLPSSRSHSDGRADTGGHAHVRMSVIAARVEPS